MANTGKFLGLTNGLPSEELAVNTSAGAGDAAKIARLDATGRWDTTMMPVGIVAETMSVVSSENLAAGALVNLWSNAGVLNVRNADGSAAGKAADGFVLTAVTSPAAATVYLEEASITGLSGLTIGADVFLSTTVAGVATNTVPSGTGKVAQFVGKSLTTTSVQFRPRQAITLA